MRIAIIKFGALGDVLRSTAVLKPLHRHYPDCEIFWFTLPSAIPLLERNPLITQIVDVQNADASVFTALEYDLVIGLEEDAEACALASRLKTRELFGACRDKNGKLTYTASSRQWFDMSLLNRDPDGSLNTANRLKQENRKTYPRILFEMLGMPEAFWADAEPVIVLSPEAKIWAEERFIKMFKPGLPRIGLNTGSGVRWPTKQLTVDKTLSVIKAIDGGLSANLLLLGGPDEEERNACIKKNCSVPLVDTGTKNSLQEFMAIIDLCDAVITSDSLALHIAIALKKKIIVFFGPTSADEIELYGRGIKWLPKQQCVCYYQSKCHVSKFCLDAIDENVVTNVLREWF
jgi:heptosyltransferase-2